MYSSYVHKCISVYTCRCINVNINIYIYIYVYVHTWYICMWITDINPCAYIYIYILPLPIPHWLGAFHIYEWLLASTYAAS